MIDRTHPLPIGRQAAALGISRGSVYYVPRPVPDADLALMRQLDALHLEFPYAGARMLRRLLQREGVRVGRRHVATLMRLDLSPLSGHVRIGGPGVRKALPRGSSWPRTRPAPAPSTRSSGGSGRRTLMTSWWP